MKKEGLKKGNEEEIITVKKGFGKPLWPLCRTLYSEIGEFVVSFF